VSSCAPENRIRVKVTGFDKSILDFAFDAEQLNPTRRQTLPVSGAARRGDRGAAQ
jgi:hypothetical protein